MKTKHQQLWDKGQNVPMKNAYIGHSSQHEGGKNKQKNVFGKKNEAKVLSTPETVH